MKLILKCVTVMAIFTLVGCGPVYHTDYTYVPPETDYGHKCIQKCQKERKKSEHRQRKLLQECKYQQQKIALEKYKIYLEEKAAKGEEPESWKNEDSFYDSYACRSNYDCGREYRNCYRQCGGQVIENTYCVKNCD